MAEVTKQEAEWAAKPFEAFKAGVWVGFLRWEALSLAISLGWCQDGKEKRQALYEMVVNRFAAKKHNLDETKLLNALYDAMQDFNVEAEDERPEQLLTLCVRLWSDCMDKKDFRGLKVLLSAANIEVEATEGGANGDEATAGEATGDEVPVEEGKEEVKESQAEPIEDEDGDTTMEAADAAETPEPTQVPSSKPVPDEDGWTTVPKKGRRGKRR
jgi:hypothetical protein